MYLKNCCDSSSKRIANSDNANPMRWCALAGITCGSIVGPSVSVMRINR